MKKPNSPFLTSIKYNCNGDLVPAPSLIHYMVNSFSRLSSINLSSFLCHLFSGCPATTTSAAVSPERLFTAAAAVSGIIPPLQAIAPHIISATPQAGVPIVVVGIDIPRFCSVAPPGVDSIVAPAAAAAVTVVVAAWADGRAAGLAAVRRWLSEAAPHRHGMRAAGPVSVERRLVALKKN
jgi:hypothetical protein